MYCSHQSKYLNPPFTSKKYIWWIKSLCLNIVWLTCPKHKSRQKKRFMWLHLAPLLSATFFFLIDIIIHIAWLLIRFVFVFINKLISPRFNFLLSYIDYSFVFVFFVFFFYNLVYLTKHFPTGLKCSQLFVWCLMFLQKIVLIKKKSIKILACKKTQKKYPSFRHFLWL